MTGHPCYTVCIQDGHPIKDFTIEVLDSLDGDEAGIKSITFQVNGENAYGYLKSEKKASIVWSVFPRLTRLASVRPRSFPVMSCRILKKTLILK